MWGEAVSKEPDDDDITLNGRSAKEMLDNLGKDPAMDALQCLIVLVGIGLIVLLVCS